MNDGIVAGLASIIGAMMAYLASRATAVQGRKASEQVSANEFTKNLIERVENLETNVEKLNSSLQDSQDTVRVAMSYIERLIIHMLTLIDHNDIPPVPDRLQEKIGIKIGGDR